MDNHAALPPYSATNNPVTLPPPYTGTDERTPGPWSVHVKTLPWLAARKGSFIKSDFHKFLPTMEPRREPTLRPDNVLFGSNIANAEAIYMQMVGRWAEQECTHCQQEEGPFPHCVVIDTLGWPKKCANCHWGGNSRQCSDFIERPDQYSRPIIPHASFRQPAPSELNTLRSIIVDLTSAISYADQATHDNLEAWRSSRGMAQELRSRLNQGDHIRTSDVRRVRAQILAGVGRGHTVQFAGQAVARHIQDLQSAVDALVHRYSE
ncbi:uncharacterized protein N7487_005383 [Penicillium crustosum]|uniref:uncharacterized protein n=1 Tax=Penicillium crustosum TaxID=36656 RepID=UPI00239C09F2|nr:uncharacterized protein N7487_005383 [Penicillium crustosum]KAJ5411024.1 hypothetical protein N7487_005383 [Penicillium crustosum]